MFYKAETSVKPDLFHAFLSSFASLSKFAIGYWKKKNIREVKLVIQGVDAYDETQMLQHHILADVS